MTVRFEKSSGFYEELKRRVNDYFEGAQLSPHANKRFYLKAISLFAWFILSYVLLVFYVSSAFFAILLAISIGLAAASIGFNVSHDGNHGASSKRNRVNRVMLHSLDLIGASSYIWNWKHNVFHHSFTNIVGADDDINNYPIFRVTRDQKRMWIHHFQHLYVWPFYGLTALYWQFFSDFKSFIRGHVGQSRFPRPRGLDLFFFAGGKIFFVFWAVVFPMFFHSVWHVLGLYLLASFTLGFTISVVFQLAHCVEAAEFPTPTPGTEKIEAEWAVHQISTTVDFARGNRLLSWYMGGLNFQIEHHLFPRVCHVHYPAIAKIVEKTCEEFGVRYFAHRTFLGAVLSHGRWLQGLSRT